MARISRRHLFRRFAALALGAGGRVLAGCTPGARPTQPAPTQTVATSPTLDPATPPPTPAPSATPTPAPPSRPEIIRFHPDAPSTVVHARHAGAWQGEDLSPAALREMLDASITALTGLADARAAWAALFRPHERIAIKVNAFLNSKVWTHAPLVAAVTDCLQEAGVPPEQIFIYDRQSDELKGAGYRVNYMDPGVRCYGNGGLYTGDWRIADVPVRLSKLLLSCDALINMPILKTHGDAGISYALKNHYGTVDPLPLLHQEGFDPAISQLNALPPIKDRTRLVIGDVLGICLQEHREWPFWREAKPGDAILVGYDPVAVDTVALRLFSEALTANGGDPRWAEKRANSWLALAAALGVGTNDEANMKLVQLALG